MLPVPALNSLSPGRRQHQCLVAAYVNDIQQRYRKTSLLSEAPPAHVHSGDNVIANKFCLWDVSPAITLHFWRFVFPEKAQNAWFSFCRKYLLPLNFKIKKPLFAGDRFEYPYFPVRFVVLRRRTKQAYPPVISSRHAAVRARTITRPFYRLD